ncbi:glycosyl hydrolase family 95 catalytic domain-containing protein [Nocardiopsis ganjiahuensis]|uniref:glycosyl hydrolase family 95 catalytic domain-containing protein n=1 Tax=Nocardiopsis ganjiahuensis TaxID=239984 RepID=UPI00034C3200|nr:glycoside hydrolase N-terminal domain-containing protein [Nocardiopsis ganjiahuensis]
MTHSCDRPPGRTVRTRSPVRDWEDALISGNGRQGALVHSGPDRTRITLSHERLFLPVREPLPAPHTAPVLPELRALLGEGRSRSAAELITEVAAGEGYEGTHWIDPLVGAAVLSFAPERPGSGAVTRTCDLDTGEVTEELPDGTVHRVFASRADDVVVCDLHRPHGLDGRLTLGVLAEEPPVALRVRPGAGAGRLSLTVSFPDRPEGGLAGYTVTCSVTAEGGTAEPDGEGLRVRGVRRLVLLLRTETAAPGAERAPATAELPAGPPALLLERHRRLHGELMGRFRLRLAGAAPDGGRGLRPEPGHGAAPELVTRLVDAGRYAVVSSCGDLPPTLQGVWSGTHDPPWRSGYTFDGNLPSALAGLHPTGTPELMTPLFDLLDGFAEDLRENARRLYGCRGILVPAHASTSGRHNHFGPEWCLTCWTAGGAWLARLYWDHYSYTRDRGFLLRRALPFLTEAAEFHEDFLCEGGFSPSYSPENTPADGDGQACVNATMDVAAVRDLTRNLVRAHRALGIPGARRWVRLAARLPGYRIGPDGCLAEWAGPAGPVAQTDRHAHRHASHLYPLWYERDPAFADPVLAGAAARAVRARLAWWRGQEADEMAFGLVQLGLAAAGLGMAEEAHEALSLLAGRYWRPTMVPTHNRGRILNVDIGGGFPALVAAMLVGSAEGRIEVLPALPREWSSGCVEGLRARGGVVVDRLEWDAGGVSVELRSLEGGPLLVRMPDGDRRIRLSDGSPVRIIGKLPTNWKHS